MSGAQGGPVESPVRSAPTRPQYPHYSWQAHYPPSSLQYITDHREADIALSQLAPGPLGFDLEWRPNYRKGAKENPVALVQLASHDTILLLHVSYMSEFPSKLRELLSDSSRVKAGVSIKDDCLKLFRDYGVSTRNCVELALLARSVDNAKWKGKYINPIGLSHLLETYENFSLAKGKVQRSNWELHLNPLQQSYAANDACAGVVNGSLLDHLGISEWSPQNPYYDPGPPPPPREPKVKNEGAPISPATATNPRARPTHRGTAHRGTVHRGTAHRGTAHRGTVHRGTAHRGTVHRGTVHRGTAHRGTAHRGTAHRGTSHRYPHAGTTNQFHNAQQFTPIVLTTVRAPDWSAADAAGSRAWAPGVAPREYDAAAGRYENFGPAGGYRW